MSQRQQLVRTTHAMGRLLNVKNTKYTDEIKRFIFTSYESDIADFDITGDLISESRQRVAANIIAKGSGIISGLEEVKYFLAINCKQVMFKTRVADGQQVNKGMVVATLEGTFGDITVVERTVLNALGRMSGIATITRVFVKKAGVMVLVTPTRKTYWGLLDKKACSVGGAGTHRLNLGDAVLFKDTHMKLAGRKLEKILINIFASKKTGRFIEIEVQNSGQALKVARIVKEHAAMAKGKNIFMMFDNFKPEGIRKTLSLLRSKGLAGNIYFEASGGVTLDNISAFAKTGVDIVSVGALTHSARAMDFSLRII
jgi:nicotinate-nucleotide pyrophosphorylase (carboxylating)